MEFFILRNKIEVNNGQHGWAVVKFKGYTMYVNALVVSEETANYVDTYAVGEAVTKYIKEVQREITAHEAYDALIEAFGGAKVVCDAIEDEYIKAQNESYKVVAERIDNLPTDISVERLRGQIEALCELCEIELRMTRKGKRNSNGLYVYASNGKQAYVELGSDYHTLKRMISDLGYPIPFLVKHEYVDGVATGNKTRIDIV